MSRLFSELTALFPQNQVGYLRQITPLFRFSAFDTSTPDGRAQERYRRVFLTILALILGRGIFVLTTLISVPMTLPYLGSERYGLWATLSSLITIFVSFADLGMGYGLMNAVSTAEGRNEPEAARQHISSAFFMLFCIGISVAGVFWALYGVVDWASLLHVTSAQAKMELAPSLAVFVGCFALNLPLGVVNRTQLACQEGFINSIWNGAGSLLGLAGLILCVRFNAGLPWLVLSMSAAPVIATLFNGLFLFGFQRPVFRPGWQFIRSQACQDLIKVGLIFFAMQAAATVALFSDNIILSRKLGPDAVTQYAIPMNLINLFTSVATVLLSTLWPAYSEALSRGDIPWIKNTLYRSLLIFVSGSIVVALGIILAGKPLVSLWTSGRVIPSFTLLVGAALWLIVGTTSNVIQILYNGIGYLKFPAVCIVLMAVSALFFKFILIDYMGSTGAVYATIFSYVVFLLIPMGLKVPMVLAELQPKAEVPL